MMRSEPFGCMRDALKSADNVGIKMEIHKGVYIFLSMVGFYFYFYYDAFI